MDGCSPPPPPLLYTNSCKSLPPGRRTLDSADIGNDDYCVPLYLATTSLHKLNACNPPPPKVDPSVGFDQVGGLDAYVEALKEMVFLPLVYPELFDRFHVQPPRGVLFYGPPGTGGQGQGVKGRGYVRGQRRKRPASNRKAHSATEA